jgi:hypothetical protein
MNMKNPILKFIFKLIGILLLPAGLLGQNVSNYTFTALAGSYTQVQGLPGAVSPALSGGNSDDGYFNSKPIGFSFIYDGIPYTTFSASTNGWLTLGNTISGSATTNNLATGTPRPIIAPLWDDLMLNASNGFSYYLSGTSPNRVMTIEWLNMHWNYLSASSVIDFQVKLYENNRRIEFVYRPNAGAGNSESASIGLAGTGTNIFLSLNGTGATPVASSVAETNTLSGSPVNGQIYRFDHYVVPPTITSISPLTGNTNDLITITGTNFDLTISNDICYFGTVRANVLTAGSTQLVVAVPVNAKYCFPTVTTLSSHLTAIAPLPFDITFGCGGSISNSAFTSPVSFSTGSVARTIAFQDIDGDGKTDIAVSTDAGATVLRNTSSTGVINSSSFAAAYSFTASDPSAKIAFGDIDGDGKREMISANYTSSGQDSISIYKNTSTPGVINASTFAPRVNYKCGGYPTATLEDIDMDGKPELLVAERSANQLSIRKNNSSPGVINTSTFGANVSFPLGNYPNSFVTGDIDGDGKPDVVSVNAMGNSISVLRNTSTPGVINSGTFAPKIDLATAFGGLYIKLGDMDGDGKIDVTVCSDGNASGLTIFSIFRNTSVPGSISFASRSDFTTNTSYGREFDLGDVNGDGKPDIVQVVGGATNYIHILENSSTPGTISLAWNFNYLMSGNPFDLGVTDLDGDGKPEIAVTDLSGASVGVYRNTVSAFNSIAPASVLNSTSYCDDGTWKTFYDPALPTNLLVAIKDNGNNLGTTTVSEYKDPAPGNYNGIRFLARHFKITPATQPSSAIQVRLYFTPAEFSALQSVDPALLSISNLSVTKYDGPTEDNVYYPQDATSLTWIPPGSIVNASAFGGNYIEFTISSFSEFWIHPGSGPLPIELLSFNATSREENVLLDWSTATETNNDYFTLEKTRDGINFETVAIVDGSGNSSVMHNYSFMDEHPYNGSSYYRLKQTDFNGHFTYSEFREVEFVNEDDLFSVFPNPGNGTVHIICPGEADSPVSLEIFDNSGRMVEKKDCSVDQLQTQPISLKQGIYSVVVIRGSVRFVRQLVVL